VAFRLSLLGRHRPGPTTRDGETTENYAHSDAESKHAVIRYNGSQYYRDRTITAAEKKAIQNVLLAYESLARS